MITLEHFLMEGSNFSVFATVDIHENVYTVCLCETVDRDKSKYNFKNFKFDNMEYAFRKFCEIRDLIKGGDATCENLRNLLQN